jgi:uncharacterized membrane protein
VKAYVEMASVLITGIGLLSAVAAVCITRAFRPGAGVLLDFLMAAGLIRMAADPRWGTLALTAAVIALRRMVSRSLLSKVHRETP